MTPVGEANDPFEADDMPVVKLVSPEKFGIILKGPQEPAQLPQRTAVAIQPGADAGPGIGGRFQNLERCRNTRLSRVAGGTEPYDASAVKTFLERTSFCRPAETFDFRAHDGLLSGMRGGAP
jgi:hypothetical protein